MDYADVAGNPHPHIHLPRKWVSGDGGELQISDLGTTFPTSPFVVRLGTASNAPRVRVTPVLAAQVKPGDRVLVAIRGLRQRGVEVPAAIGDIGIEARMDATSGESYVLVTVRSEEGSAQARISEDHWNSLTTIGLTEDLP